MSDLRVYERFSDAVGTTPLVRLRRSVEGLGCQVWAKLEFMNPMGSIKDRMARHLVLEALEDGRLRVGDSLVEASSGNTAMGLAMMAAQEGLGCKMVVRSQTSKEKLDCLRALGVELVLVDGDLPADHPDSYNRRARRVAEETPNAFFPDQHNNRSNNAAHYATTGPEIWRQMEGRVDVVVAGIGTGGTISGVARYLKEQDPSVRIVAVDIEGSIFTGYFKTGEVCEPGPYVLEGLGDEELIDCPEWELIDDMIQVTDGEAFLAARDLARSEAMLVGGSSGAALWGTRQVAAGLGPEARIVTIFPDSGARYLSTIYNDDWMRERGYL
ncbi:MAG: cysteine synthase family protein [Acidobacteriota bacterium]|nr:cysteine synthase family protein [Acidobacteriota bacterium]